MIRRPRALGFLTDFSRLNRRMHNKSFTADNQATIVGGRNVGDEYFGATDAVLFSDLDVLAIGPVVNDVSKDFDRYWASGSSYPVDRLLPPASPAALAELASAASLVERDPAAAAYTRAVRESAFVGELLRGELALQWASTHMLSDDPDKALGRADDKLMLFGKLREEIGRAKMELEIVSPYFVPTEAGVEALAALASRGVKIRVLTNSLEATDVGAVHAGYAKYRKPMLEAGIGLYESRRAPADTGKRKKSGLGSSSASSLHAKTFSVDRTRIFVGSFNFDPRSAELNTELGFVIDSPEMARGMATAFDDVIPRSSYQVQLSPAGQLAWIERRGDALVTHLTEPGTSAWQRAWIWFLSVLPIERML